MEEQIVNNKIEFVKGIGPARADLLKKELQIFTFEDLLYYFPYRYVDRSKFQKVADIYTDEDFVQLKGKITAVEVFGKGRNSRMSANFTDETGHIELVWFAGIRFVKNKVLANKKYVVFGKPKYFKGKFNIPHPDIEDFEKFSVHTARNWQPVYHSSEKLKSKGFNSKGFSNVMINLFDKTKGHIPEILSNDILERLNLLSREKALVNIHFPENSKKLSRARTRLIFDEFFFLQLQLLRQKLVRLYQTNGHTFSVVGHKLNEFYKKNLPFELTNAQKRVIKEIRKDMGSGKQMNRLLQGDVGSGKTLVALMCMLIAIDNGYQCCLMVPTEILATQHFSSISHFIERLDLNIALLTGSTKKSDRTLLHEQLQDGSIHILIGTHALIEDNVVFKDLGFVVIDEQHRFGVAQRAKLWKKNAIPPHVLVMTATPIPRTLSMTLYGDLDISVIDELPPGRKTIKTYHFYENRREKLYGFLKQEIKKGRQIYIVYPLISESEVLDLNALEDGYEQLCEIFRQPDYSVSMVHGQMKAKEKEEQMQKFVNQETQILLATTVIEVGVDVPNASVMVIENAERFGLSQLHQLRGRVGRGVDQSYCILMTTNKITKAGKTRLAAMVETTDGFKIADYDLKSRGPGDIQGIQQSGILDFKIANIAQDSKILTTARAASKYILEKDPNFEKPENKQIREQYLKLRSKKTDFSRIG